MDLTLWIIAWVLAAVFTGAGLYKLLVPYAKVAAVPEHGWARGLAPVRVKLIGLVELLGAAGLVLPPLVGVAEWLVPLAAAGLVLDMAVALAVHMRLGDPFPQRVPPVVLGLLALVVLVGRSVTAPF